MICSWNLSAVSTVRIMLHFAHVTRLPFAEETYIVFFWSITRAICRIQKIRLSVAGPLTCLIWLESLPAWNYSGTVEVFSSCTAILFSHDARSSAMVTSAWRTGTNVRDRADLVFALIVQEIVPERFKSSLASPSYTT